MTPGRLAGNLSIKILLSARAYNNLLGEASRLAAPGNLMVYLACCSRNCGHSGRKFNQDAAYGGGFRTGFNLDWGRVPDSVHPAI